MEVSIEPISEKYAPSFHACLDSVAREKKFLAQTQAVPLDRFLAFVKESVKNDAAQFIAVDGRLVVGWCDVFPDWPEATKHCGTLGMGVLKDYRRHGIGGRLLLAALAKAKAKGIIRVSLHVRADNAGAIKLYEETGFVVEATLKNSMKFDGLYFDELQMSLTLSDIP